MEVWNRHVQAGLGCALALSFAIAAPAAAQPDTRRAAREAFTRAERAFDEHDYELALELFRRAQELRPHDAVRFNVAVCLERLGRFREALAEYELARASDQLDAAAREEAERLGVRTRARLGSLAITGAPEGALVRVGALSCALPCSLDLDPGTHRVEIEGGIAREVRITRGGEHTLEIDGRDTEAPAPGGWQSFGWLSGIGGAAAAVGLAGVIGLGLYTEDLGARYRASPSLALRNEGLTMRDWTNASIALAATGLVAVVIDLVIWLADPPRASELSARRPGVITF